MARIGGVQIATASTGVPDFSSSPKVLKVMTPSRAMPRWLTNPVSLKRGFRAITGRC
jgi:hypothetical protein